MDVDGVDDNGTARDELVEAEIEGTARFGGRGEFFVPWDLCRGRTKRKGGQKENTKNNLGMVMMGAMESGRDLFAEGRLN